MDSQQIYELFLFLSAAAISCSAAEVPEYREECHVFDNITGHIVQQRGLHMHCTRNPQCTGFDCSGQYQYRGPFTGFKPFVLPFCVGMTLHPCAQPINIEIYMELPTYHRSHAWTITHDQKVQIPGLHYEISDAMDLDGFLGINMERYHNPNNNKNYLNIGIKFMVRQRVKRLNFEIWPEGMQRYLMPNASVPIPACERDVVTPTHTPGICDTNHSHPSTPKVIPFSHASPSVSRVTNHSHPSTPKVIPFSHASPSVSRVTNLSHPPSSKPLPHPTRTGYHGSTRTRPAGPTTQSTVTMVTGSYGRKCDPGSLDACGPFMQCGTMETDTMETVCLCMDGYILSGNTCTGSTVHTGMPSQLPHTGTTPVHKATGSKSSGISTETRNIIIGAVSGSAAAILLAAVAVLMLMRYRRHSARYRGHQLLLSEDGDFEDTNPVA